ncbi:MAG: DUF6247 family protein [Candidatus Poribacteria bacterium]|nr:DUF6247 family protein [Candidatus Poribacteria bacterium]
MATIDLRTEAKQILDGLSEESLTVAFGLLKALQNQKLPNRADLLSVYPWARYLSDEERDEFFAELSDATKGARKSGDWSIVDEVIDAWRETAEILGDEETMADIVEAEKQIDKGEVVSWDVVKQRLHIRSS